MAATTSTSTSPARRRRTAEGVVRAEVDGVPAFWPVEAAPGPLSALLVFRVGQADESLPLRGVTHLVEHLALARTEWGVHAFNGTTGSTTTTFSVAGEPEQVRDYLTTVTRTLGDLPVDRLEHEQQVLRTEEAGRGFASSVLWRLRWGPQGPGVIGYGELGVGRLRGPRIQSWADTRFVRQAAALVLSGPPPRGLRLDLKEGVAPPPVVLPDPVDALPAHYAAGPGGFGLSWLPTRSAPARAASWLLESRLTERLRFRDGLVYGVGGDSDPLTPDHRHAVLWSECLPENAAAAGEALLDVLGELKRDGRWTPAEQERYRAQAQPPEDPRFLTGYAYYLAHATLHGETPQKRKEVTAEALRVDAGAVAEAVEQALSSLLVGVPGEVPVPAELARPISDSSGEPVRGRALIPAHGQKSRLVLGSEGISEVAEDGRTVSVLFSQCRGVLAYDDGARTLLGADGFAVAYYPEQWREPIAKVHSQMDAALPPGLIIPFGVREPFQPPAVNGLARAVNLLPSFRLLGLVMCTFCGLLALVTTIALVVDDDPAITADLVVFMAALTAGTLAWPTRVLITWLRRRSTA